MNDEDNIRLYKLFLAALSDAANKGERTVLLFDVISKHRGKVQVEAVLKLVKQAKPKPTLRVIQ